MKILFLTGISSIHKTGLFNSITDRIQYLSDKSIQVKLISIVEIDAFYVKWIKRILKIPLSYENNRLDEESLEGLRIEYKHVKKSLFNKIFEFSLPTLYFKHQIRQMGLDKISGITLIHAHWLYPHGYYAYILSKLNHIPYLVTGHGSDVHTLPFSNPIKKRLTRIILNNSYKNFFVSQSLMKIAKEKLNAPAGGTVTYNGIKRDTLLSCNKNNNDKVLRIGFVGNLDKTKGADLLLSIFSEIQNMCDEKIHFYIVGDGVYFNNIKSQLLMQQNIRVNLKGKLSRKETLGIINDMNLVIIPSRNEGFGIVAIEALLCGTKVVSTNIGGLPEILGGLDLIFKDNLTMKNMRGFARFCLRVMFSEDLSEDMLKERGQVFSLKNSVGKEIECYNQIEKDIR